MSWTIRVIDDDFMVVEVTESTVLGSAIVDFDDGSFVEFAAHELSVIRWGATRTATGRTLVRLLGNDDLMTAFDQRSIPDRCTLERSAPTSADVERLGHVAQALMFRDHDRPFRRAMWEIEALSEFGQLDIVQSIDAVPSGIVLEGMAELAASTVSSPIWSELADRVRSAVSRASALPQLDVEHRQRLRSLHVKLSAGSNRDVDDKFEDLIDAPLGHVRGQPRTRELLVRSIDRKPVLRLDRSRLPPQLDVGFGSEIAMTRTGHRYEISISEVTDSPGELWLRAFTPAQESGAPGVLLHLAVLRHDAKEAALNATVDFVPADFESGTVLMEVVDDAQRFDPLPTSWRYWAAASQSDLVALRILDADSSNRATGSFRNVRQSIDRAVQHLSEVERQDVLRLVGDLPPLGFVTPKILPLG